MVDQMPSPLSFREIEHVPCASKRLWQLWGLAAYHTNSKTYQTNLTNNRDNKAQRYEDATWNSKAVTLQRTFTLVWQGYDAGTATWEDVKEKAVAEFCSALTRGALVSRLTTAKLHSYELQHHPFIPPTDRPDDPRWTRQSGLIRFESRARAHVPPAPPLPACLGKA